MKHLNTIFLFLSTFVIAQTNISSGNVSGIWGISGSPYIINGNILIPNNQTLTIEPGVVVEFMGKYKLFCNGTLIANGSASNKITFTSNNSDGWVGIKFENTPTTNATSILKFCEIKKIKSDITGNYKGSVYFLNYSNCIIENCLFKDNYALYGGGAILFDNSNITVKNCTFINNFSDNGGNCIEVHNSNFTVEGSNFYDSGIYSYNSNLVIKDNLFENSLSQGGITSFGGNNGQLVKNIEIIKNRFINNNNENGAGGGALLLYDMEGLIQNNVFENNETNYGGGAITCFRTQTYAPITNLFIVNNLFFNNSSGISPIGVTKGGGAINLKKMSPRIVNNTIVKNHSTDFGGGIQCDFNSDPLFYNNIFYGNSINSGTENIFLNDNDSNPSFYNNLIQGSINSNGNPVEGDFTNNVDINPNFTNYNNNEFTLSSNSGCINAGYQNTVGLNIPTLDLSNNQRIINNLIDIGAYEFQSNLGFEDISELEQIIFYPNPVKEFLNFKTEHIISKIEVYDISGRILISNSNSENKLDLSDLKTGNYILKLYTEKGIMNTKIIKE
jgi:hypothetical protein